MRALLLAVAVLLPSTAAARDAGDPIRLAYSEGDVAGLVKNFELNAEDGRVVFRTVVPTPTPRVLDMELVRGDAQRIDRPGGRVGVVRFTLRPTIHPLVDPIVHRFTPVTDFFIVPRKPPALARFAGPRNYAGQAIALE